MNLVGKHNSFTLCRIECTVGNDWPKKIQNKKGWSKKSTIFFILVSISKIDAKHNAGGRESKKLWKEKCKAWSSLNLYMNQIINIDYIKRS